MDFTSIVPGLQHIGVPTNDIAVSVAFYQSLGFRIELETYNAAADEKVTFLRLGDLVIETYENRRAVGHTGSIDHIALDTTDVDKAFEIAKAKGLHLLDAEVNFLPFWEKGVRFFTILGPNQEKVEFCQRL